MTIYGRMNAYDMYKEIRGNIGEAAAAHWTDRGILRKMNVAQRSLWMQLVNEPDGDWFLASVAVTPVASVITLPDDCAKPVHLEQTNDGAVIPIRGTVRERALSRGDGYVPSWGFSEAYLSSNTLVVNTASFTDACTLWYQQRIRDMHFGTAGASSAATLLHMDTSMGLHYEDDYYNLRAVEIQTSGLVPDIVDTITDFAASTALATITGTPTSGDFYGTVSQLPEEAMDLLVMMVTTRCLSKPGSDVDPSYINYFRAERKEAKETWDDWIARKIDASRHIRITEDY